MIATPPPATNYNYTYTTSSIGVSREAEFVESNRKKREAYFLSSSITAKEVLEVQLKLHFDQLKKKWLDETMFYSNPNKIYQNPNYLKIISLGKGAIPLILEDWKTSNNHWFHALNVITGENPVKPENRGRIKLMKKDWIEFIEPRLSLYVYNASRRISEHF